MGICLVVLMGWILGCAVQLQQAQLWLAHHYLLLGLIPHVFIGFVAIKLAAKGGFFHNRLRFISRSTAGAALLMLSAALLGFGLTGLRALAFQADALAAQLEGVDIQVVGVVAAMPQRSEAGLRFLLDYQN